MGITDDDNGNDKDNDDVGDDELDNVNAQASSIIPRKAPSLFVFPPNLSLVSSSTVSKDFNNMYRPFSLHFHWFYCQSRSHLNYLLNNEHLGQRNGRPRIKK